jgi:hypothetical protein
MNRGVEHLGDGAAQPLGIWNADCARYPANPLTHQIGCPAYRAANPPGEVLEAML